MRMVRYAAICTCTSAGETIYRHVGGNCCSGSNVCCHDCHDTTKQTGAYAKETCFNISDTEPNASAAGGTATTSIIFLHSSTAIGTIHSSAANAATEYRYTTAGTKSKLCEPGSHCGR